MSHGRLNSGIVEGNLNFGVCLGGGGADGGSSGGLDCRFREQGILMVEFVL